MTLAADAVFDLAHLDRQTLGDAGLRTEILALLDAELARLGPAVQAAAGAERAALAHRLKGAARGTGAFALAAAAEALEASPDSAPLTAGLLLRMAEVRAVLAAGIPRSAGNSGRG